MEFVPSQNGQKHCSSRAALLGKKMLFFPSLICFTYHFIFGSVTARQWRKQSRGTLAVSLKDEDTLKKRWAYFYINTHVSPSLLLGFICAVLRALLDSVPIPAASVLTVSLPGILRGSADAVSDTFRILPFIFPPTQPPCTVAAERCWNLHFFFPFFSLHAPTNTDLQRRTEGGEGRALRADHCGSVHHKRRQIIKKKQCFCCSSRRAENRGDPSHFTAHEWVHEGKRCV